MIEMKSTQATASNPIVFTFEKNFVVVDLWDRYLFNDEILGLDRGQPMPKAI